MTNPPNVSIVLDSANRRAEIAELLNLCLGHKLTGQRDADYWAWKHERNPFGPSILLLAEADGQLVGVRRVESGEWRAESGGRRSEC